MTLDCTSFRLQQPRVISVHSYYLTSLVNLSFCGLDVTFNFFRNTFQSQPLLHSLSVNHLYVGTFPLSGKVHLCGASSGLYFPSRLYSSFKISKSCYFYMSLFSYVDFVPFDNYLDQLLLFTFRNPVADWVNFTCTLVSPFLPIN